MPLLQSAQRGRPCQCTNTQSRFRHRRLQFRSELSKAFHREGCKSLFLRAQAINQSASSDASSGTGLQGVEDGVIIAGAGIAGLATAAALQKVGIHAAVLERDPGPRLEGSAIGLWPNAFKALDALGVATPLREAHPILQRIELSRVNGTHLRQFSLDECQGAPHEFRGVLRSSLLRTLESNLKPGTVRYNSGIAEVIDDVQGTRVILQSGEIVRGRAVVGADGARSAVASALNMGVPSYAGYSAYRGVAEFDRSLPVRRDTVRQILGQGVRAGMYPLSDRSLYWFIAMNCPADAAPPEDKYKEDCLNLVRGWQAGIVEAVHKTPGDAITRNRIGDRWLVPSKPFGRGCITLAGDSAHPMTPNLGQGGCTALEDAVILAQELRNTVRQRGTPLAGLPASVVQDALRAYERKRTLRVTKITVRSNIMGRILGEAVTVKAAKETLDIEFKFPSDLQLESG